MEPGIMADTNMSPEQASDVLYAASNAAPLNKAQHMQCEQAKAVLDVAFERLQELDKEKNKTKGDK